MLAGVSVSSLRVSTHASVRRRLLRRTKKPSFSPGFNSRLREEATKGLG